MTMAEVRVPGIRALDMVGSENVTVDATVRLLKEPEPKRLKRWPNRSWSFSEQLFANALDPRAESICNQGAGGSSLERRRPS
ncbi:hypothetical protein DSLASN_45170 [Desulfoluna limicola]|uniref:Uncharacterized protein n=1 Tax=Desulfoluna limicola TaxID=2810562 RepID=A0ABN6FDH2_9BACT|nr:hypothetical protein DSLASN_45170 [Desulfoluna limicola]